MKSSENETNQYLEEKLSLLAQSITILFDDLSPDVKAKILARESLEEIISVQKRIYKNEFLINVESLGTVGAAEVAREEALGYLFNID